MMSLLMTAPQQAMLPLPSDLLLSLILTLTPTLALTLMIQTTKMLLMSLLLMVMLLSFHPLIQLTSSTPTAAMWSTQLNLPMEISICPQLMAIS